jgi:MFS transporter, OFA family, oxalate/formate antiporter
MNNKNTTGWIVTSAALGVNLLLGLLYAWGVFKKALVIDWGWTNTAASVPYTVSAAVFAFFMIFAGRLQDKFGPRYVVMLGGLLFGTGLISSGFVSTPLIMSLTFGVIGGIGLGLGYSATTPCAIKWFDSSKKGIISGIVVSGVGLAPVYIAPLTNYFINKYGIQNTFIILGVIAFVCISIFSLFLKNPPAGHIPKGYVQPKVTAREFTWKEMLKTKQFILLWFAYLLTATAGLMLIAHIASIALTQAGWQGGYLLIVVLSVFNALGRIAAGFLSDLIGRTRAMILVFFLQAVNMFIFTFYSSVPLLIAGTALAGLSYGALFSLFPSTTADFFGLKNLGVNYGLVFTGWGIAGIVGPILGGQVADITGTYTFSYIVAGVLLLAGILMVKLLRAPKVDK